MSIRDLIRGERAANNVEALRVAVRGPKGVEGSCLNWRAPGQWGPGPDVATWERQQQGGIFRSDAERDAFDPGLWLWKERWAWVDGRHFGWALERLTPLAVEIMVETLAKED